MERELFVRHFLDKVIPPVFRIGTGEAVDRFATRSGQLDIVVEYPFFPCLSGLPGEVQIYLAESVAAIIEIKSDLTKQWDELVATHTKIRELKRDIDDPPPHEFYGSRLMDGPEYRVVSDDHLGPFTYTEIPMFAVGYKGPAQLDTLRDKLVSQGLSGILVLERQLYCGIARGQVVKAQGNCSLWAFVCAVTDSARALLHSTFDPMSYTSNFLSAGSLPANVLAGRVAQGAAPDRGGI